MSFVFSKTTPSTGAQAMFEFKEHLVNNVGWSVVESSDGSTYNASGDQITSGGTGAGGMENNNAWFRLQHPFGSGNDEILVQRGTTNLVWRIKHSREDGFTGGSPSATQVSSATDEGLLYGAGTDASPTFSTLFAADGGYRWNVGADNTSPYGFWAGAFPTGGGNPTTAFIWDPLVATESTDAWDFAFYISGSNPFKDDSLSTASFSATSNALWSLVASATPTTYAFMTAWVLYDLAATAVAVPNGLPTNPVNNKDEVFPLVLGRRTAQGSNPGYKGITTLMKWTGISRATGDTLTVSTTSDRIIYRHVSLPWDGTTPSV